LISQISPTDAENGEKLNPAVKSKVLYSGVDLEYFSPDDSIQRDPNAIVHVGTLDPSTKLPAMLWFYEKVFPEVKKEFPDAFLELAGYMPKCSMYDADSANVIVHGLVPDVRPYLAKGAVFISPQFVGSGIRIKILNAMAMKNAVVATSVACEGLPVEDGKNILIADTEEEFVEKICRLLREPEMVMNVGQNARCLIEENFSWPSIAEILERHLTETIDNNIGELSAKQHKDD